MVDRAWDLGGGGQVWGGYRGFLGGDGAHGRPPLRGHGECFPRVEERGSGNGWKNEGVATLLCWKAAVEVYAAGHPSLGMPDCQSPAGWALFRKFRKLMVRSRGSRKIFDLCKLEPWLQDPSQWMSSANTSGLPSRLEAGPLRGSGSVERLLPVLPSSTSVTQKGS